MPPHSVGRKSRVRDSVTWSRGDEIPYTYSPRAAAEGHRIFRHAASGIFYIFQHFPTSTELGGLAVPPRRRGTRSLHGTSNGNGHLHLHLRLLAKVGASLEDAVRFDVFIKDLTQEKVVDVAKAFYKELKHLGPEKQAGNLVSPNTNTVLVFRTRTQFSDSARAHLVVLPLPLGLSCLPWAA